MNQLIIN